MKTKSPLTPEGGSAAARAATPKTRVAPKWNSLVVYLRLWAALVLPLWGAGGLFAQIQTTLSVNAPYSTLVSDYITNFNRAITLQLVNTGNAPLDVRISGTLRGSSGVIIFLPDDLGSFRRNSGQGITIPARQTKLFRATDIETMFPREYTVNNSSANLRPALISSLILPEGDYELCVKVFEANSNRALAEPVCAYFSISNIEPPFLLSPVDKDPMPTATATYQPVQFQWTYPAGASPTKIEYVLQVAELRAGQNEYNVFQSGPPFAEIVIPTSNPIYIFKPADPRFEVGRTYAWRVQVRGKGTNAGLVNFQNNGLSTVNTFTYGGTPNPASGSNIVSSSDALTGTKKAEPAKPVVNLSGGTCACKFPDVADKTAVPDWTNDKTIYIGSVAQGYQLSISEITGAGGKFTGNGTVALSPTFGPTDRKGLFLPLRVEFKDIQVNKDGVLLAGQIQSMKRADNLMGLMPSAATKPGMPATPGLPDADELTKIVTGGGWAKIKDKISEEAGKLFTQAEQQANQQRNGAGFETPIGYSAGPFTLAVDNIIFTATTAQYDAMTVLDALGGTDPLRIPLGVKGACMPSASCQGNTFLYLLKDTSIPYLGLTLRGGLDAANATYYSYTPNAQTGGTSELSIAADYYLKDATYLTGSDPVKADIRAKTVKGFDNWNATATIANEFKIKGIDDFTFKLNTATFDHDLESNPAGFPAMLASLETDLAGKSVATDKLANLRTPTWRGFFMDKLTVTLPSVFKSTKSSKTFVDVTNLVIDGHLGLTGSLGAGSVDKPVIRYEDGSLDGWYFSLETIGITFFDGTFIKANADGKIGLPITDKDQQSALVYTNTMSPAPAGGGLTYQFRAKPVNDLNVPIWWSKISLKNTSEVIVSVGDKTPANLTGKLFAKATLHGDISMKSPGKIAGIIPSISFSLLHFENFVVQSQPDYIQTDEQNTKTLTNFSFASPQKLLGNNKYGLDEVKLVQRDGKIGLYLHGSLDLSGDLPLKPKAGMGLSIMANPAMSGGRPNFTYDGVYLEDVDIDGELGPVHVTGGLKFIRGDATFGEGFQGNLKAKFPMNIAIAADARFGSVKDVSYWYVYASGSISPGIPIGGPFKITGFGGGAYYNMASAKIPSPTELPKPGTPDYKPKANSNGLLATVFLAMGTDNLMKGQTTLKVEWDNEGINRVGLNGTADLFSADNAPTTKGIAHGEIDISYDIRNSIFDLNGGVTVALPLLTVDAARALRIYADKNTQFIQIGNPADYNQRVKVTVAQLISGGAYFWAGNGAMPDIPLPQGIDPGTLQAMGYRSFKDLGFSGGKGGMMFGAYVGFPAPPDIEKRYEFLMFYMRLHAGMGFDVSLAKYTTPCGDRGIPGLNGWYANGQLYASAGFAFGVKVDVWFYEGDFDVASIDATAILMGGLPKPFWFKGMLYGKYNVLGGLVKGDMKFKLSVGDVCSPSQGPVDPFAEPLISEIYPKDGSIDILDNPAAQFNYPVGREIVVANSKPTKDGEGMESELLTFRIDVGFDMVKTGGATREECAANTNNTGELRIAADGMSATYYRNSSFEPESTYQVKVTGTGKQLINGVWKVMRTKKKADKPEMDKIETKVATLNTRGCPARLERNTIALTYPYENQRYVVLDAFNRQGFIAFNKVLCCFNDDIGPTKPYTLMMRFATESNPNTELEQPVTNRYPSNTEGDVVQSLQFRLPDLPGGKIVKMRLVKKPNPAYFARFKGPVFSASAKSSLGDRYNRYVSEAGKTALADADLAKTGSQNTSTNALNNGTFAMTVQRGADGSKQNVPSEVEVFGPLFFRTSIYRTYAEKVRSIQEQATGTTYDENPSKYVTIMVTTASVNVGEGFDQYDLGGLARNIRGQEKYLPPLLGTAFSPGRSNWYQQHMRPVYEANQRVRAWGGRYYQFQDSNGFNDNDLLPSVIIPYREREVPLQPNEIPSSLRFRQMPVRELANSVNLTPR